MLFLALCFFSLHLEQALYAAEDDPPPGVVRERILSRDDFQFFFRLLAPP